MTLSPALTVVIPAYNEAATIAGIVHREDSHHRRAA